MAQRDGCALQHCHMSLTPPPCEHDDPQASSCHGMYGHMALLAFHWQIGGKNKKNAVILTYESQLASPAQSVFFFSKTRGCLF